MKDSIKETIESVFNESGFDGLVQYFMESEDKTIEDATGKVKELGYGTTISKKKDNKSKKNEDTIK